MPPKYPGGGSSLEEETEERRKRRLTGAVAEQEVLAELENYVGKVYIDPETQTSGILNTRIDRRTGRRVYWFTNPDDPTGRALDLGASPTLMNPTTREIFTFAPTGVVMSGGKASESDIDRWFPSLGGDGTGAAPAYSGTKAAEESRQAFQAGESALDRDLIRERDRNALVQNTISELRALAQAKQKTESDYRNNLLALQMTGEQVLAQTLGQDEQRASALQLGLAPRGTTISEAYRGNVRGVTEAAGAQAASLGQLPDPNFDTDLAGLEAQFPQYEAPTPMLPNLPNVPVGLASGGVIAPNMIEGDVMAVDGQPVAQRGTSKVAILVGDGNMDGDEEVVIEDRAGIAPTEVIPLAGGAQTGATLLTPEQLTADPSATMQSLSPIYDFLGASKPLSFTRTRHQAPGMNLQGAGSTLQGLEQLGIKPRTIRDTATGQIWYIDELGQRRLVPRGRLGNYGLKFDDLVNMSSGEIAQYAPTRASMLAGELPIIEPGVSQRRFPAPAAPITMPPELGPLAGTALPAMDRIAALWPSLSVDVKGAIESIYNVSGITPEAAEERRRAFTPSGTATAGVRYG